VAELADALDLGSSVERHPGSSPGSRNHSGGELQAVRSGRWKLHFPHEYRSLVNGGGQGGVPSKYEQRHIELSLFDLESDPGETNNVAAEHPDEVSRLSSLAERARDDLGDTATHRRGKSVRPAGQLRNGPAGD
jgi:arylsulfatase A